MSMSHTQLTSEYMRNQFGAEAVFFTKETSHFGIYVSEADDMTAPNAILKDCRSNTSISYLSIKTVEALNAVLEAFFLDIQTFSFLS